MNKFIARRDNKIIYCSNEIGVKPILSKLNENIDFYKGADIEDTVVGKAAACLYVLAKIKFVYAHTLSELAKTYLEIIIFLLNMMNLLRKFEIGQTQIFAH